jgi:hypothetical protein
MPTTLELAAAHLEQLRRKGRATECRFVNVPDKFAKCISPNPGEGG